MKQKHRIISLLLALAFFLFSNLWIGMLPATAMPKDGSSMRPPVIPAAWQKDYSRQSDTSDLTQKDVNPYGSITTEDTYEAIGFEPATSTDMINLTSARVLKTVFNSYEQDPSKPTIFGYYTNWSQYDGRLDSCILRDTDNDNKPDSNDLDADGDFDGDDHKLCAGRGYDMANLESSPYDEIIYGFLGICGDPGPKSDMVGTACTEMGYGDDHVTFTDHWADIAAWRNNTFDGDYWSQQEGWNIGPSTYKDYLSQKNIESTKKGEQAFGALGGLYKLQKDSDLELAFSIGGWTMSCPFSEIAANQDRRRTLIESIGDVFQRFPMFDRVDIDWEYPGVESALVDPYTNEKYCSRSEGELQADGSNYARLIGELRDYLDNEPCANETADDQCDTLKDKKINIAASAVPQKMQFSNIPGLFEAGLDGINVMTYDFFGGNWAPALLHHTNLSAYDSGAEYEDKDQKDENENSVEEAVEYLQGLGVDMSKVYIGYAGYSRNALGTQIDSYSPLQGSFTAIPEGQEAIGTFDPLASEYNDVLYNYFDPEHQAGKNGYHVYTDAEANADYLYSDTSGVFMSIDTPRSVYAKAKYAEKKGLGGIFTWTIDQDAGLLANAAREGAGYELTNATIDMAPFYFCGENIDPQTCEEITGGEPGEPAPVADAGDDQTITVTEPTTVHLDGTGSYDPDGKPITFDWTQSSGPSVDLMGDDTATPHFEAPLPDGQSDSYTFELVVSNDDDKTDRDSVEVVVENEDTGAGGGACGDYDYVYPDGMETYDDGTIYPDSEATIVKASDGNLYECIEWGWCRDPNTMGAFAPGEGSDWELAWNLHEICSDNQASNYSTACSDKKEPRKPTPNTGTTPTTITIKVAGPLKVEIERVSD